MDIENARNISGHALEELSALWFTTEQKMRIMSRRWKVLSLFRDGLLQTFSKIQVSIAGTNWIVIESGLIVLYQMVLHE